MKMKLFIVSVLLVLVVFPVFPISTEADPGADPKLFDVINDPNNPVPVLPVRNEIPIIIKGGIEKCPGDYMCEALIYNVPRQYQLHMQYVSVLSAVQTPNDIENDPWINLILEWPGSTSYLFYLR